MNNNTKLLVGFIFIIVLSIFQAGINFWIQYNILNNADEMTDILDPLEVMSEKGFSYGIMLIEEVHGALLHAQNGQWEDVEEHKIVYEEIDKKEKELRHDARILISLSSIPEDKKEDVLNKLNIIEEFNLKMVEQEMNGFEAIENKDLKLANSLLIGGNHKVYKTELFQAYEDWAEIQHQIVTDTNRNISKNSQRMMYINLIISIIILIVIILILMVTRSFVSGEYNRGRKKK